MDKFLEFLKNSPTAFHAVYELSKMLEDNGFKKVSEGKRFPLQPGGKYYFTRNQSALFAFTIPTDVTNVRYNIVAAHSDSPTFKVKPNFTIDDGKYKKLNTEIYGGPILNTWLDRPLNIAGRVIYKDENKLISKLLSFDKAMCIIPNCSIHYNRELNSGYKYNPQIDLLPIYCDKSQGDCDLLDLASKKLDINKESIVSYDLYLALLDRGCLLGSNNEFICAPQIDNLECSYAAIESIINSKNDKSVNLACVFDNEEIGSSTRQGAQSMMLADTLERISYNLGLDGVAHKIALNSSFIVSADNAQGYHPNYAYKYDPTNACFMNKGIVIKNAARGSYTTDAVSQAYFINMCKNAGSKYQLNTNRSDVPGGSTLGAISLSNVSIPSVDIGLAQVAMHSCYETAGSKDLEDLLKALKEFYQNNLIINEDCVLEF